MPAATDAPSKPVTATYEGKAKIISPHPTDTTQLCVEFKDDATAFNGKKFAQFNGKGLLNASISATLFTLLHNHGIPTCFVGYGQAPNTLIYQKLAMIPLEVVVRNVALGSVCTRYGLEEGHVLCPPLVEFFYKRDDLNDPLLSDAAITALRLVPPQTTLQHITEAALAANRILTEAFAHIGITCADFKLEFGLNPNNELILADELSPDNFRLRDTATGTILDKDTFRLDEGDLLDRYEQVRDRLNQDSIQALSLPTETFTATVLVTSRKSVLSPQSRTVSQYVGDNTDGCIQQVLANKQFELTVNATHHGEARVIAEKQAKQILSNPVIEDATVTTITQNHEVR